MRGEDWNLCLLSSQCIRKLRDKRSSFKILGFRSVLRRKSRLKKIRILRQKLGTKMKKIDYQEDRVNVKHRRKVNKSNNLKKK